MRVLLAITLLAATASAQWQLQQSHTTASLRGIHALGNGVAWASGTEGTVLRTVDDGTTWQPCAIPPAAEHLDFRGIQAFDTKTAIVMSSGKGDLSRLYKTTDACQTWKLVFTNPDKEGFWDGIVADNLGSSALVIGDPVSGRFQIYASYNSGLQSWYRFEHPERAPDIKIASPTSQKESFYAASNTILTGDPFNGLFFVTGGSDGSFVYGTQWHSWPVDFNFAKFVSKPVPLAKGPTAGAFSFTTSPGCNANRRGECAFIVVGGDYKKPDETVGTASYAKVNVPSTIPNRFIPSKTPPHGYRSAVAYSPTHKAWITVGPNGTDLSTDDGRTWRPLKPTAPNADPEEDQHWNALSLPFVVGPKGRIGKLREEAIPH